MWSDCRRGRRCNQRRRALNRWNILPVRNVQGSRAIMWSPWWSQLHALLLLLLLLWIPRKKLIKDDFPLPETPGIAKWKSPSLYSRSIFVFLNYSKVSHTSGRTPSIESFIAFSQLSNFARLHLFCFSWSLPPAFCLLFSPPPLPPELPWLQPHAQP